MFDASRPGVADEEGCMGGSLSRVAPGKAKAGSRRGKGLVCLLLVLLMLGIGRTPVLAEWMQGTDLSGQDEPADRGTVVELLGEDTEDTLFSGGTLSTELQRVRVRLDNGAYAGRVIDARYARSIGFSDKYLSPALRLGDQVMLILGEEEGVLMADVADVIRERHLLWLAIAFVAGLVLIGGAKGLKTVLTLGLTVLSVFYLLIPAILKGADPIVVTIGICIGVTMLTLVLVTGVGKKTLAAVIGTTVGVVSAGLIARAVGLAASLTGMGDEESQMLMYIPGDLRMDFQGLLFAGILLGALGAAMDVAVSMSSSMFELKEHNPGLPPRGLLKAGMNVGRDIMGTMANTLILAYTGGSLHLLLLMAAFDMPFLDMVNRDLLASEIVRALAGSIGLLLTIPATALAVTALTERDPVVGIGSESDA